MDAGIFNGEGGASLMEAAPYPDLCAFGGVEGSIGKKIVHGLGQQRAIAPDRYAGFQTDAYNLPLMLKQGTVRVMESIS